MNVGMTSVLCRYYIGASGRRLDVKVTLENSDHLHLSHPELPNGTINWPLANLRKLQDQARTDQIILTLRADIAVDSALIESARLTVDDPDLITQIETLCPDLTKRDMAKGSVRKILTRISVAVAAVVLMIFVILPALANTLAYIIPIKREVAYGKAIVRQMERFFGGTAAGELVCSSTDGDAALAKMIARLTETTPTNYELHVSVMRHEMVNAFAAPGGQIVLVEGLIEHANSPDEVAAVLGHEIGHVEARDATRGALRAAGSAGLLSMVFGDFAGGTAAVVIAEYTLNASYTREAEAEADTYARTMLDGAKVSTIGMADFFGSLSDLEGSVLDLPIYLSSHPDTNERASRASDFAQRQVKTSPVLNDKEWDALRAICD
ncbi:MAG: putative Zn-dependent protease [Ascidiaceihabitans sp.]|jgi:predicted Zn-dependent protease|tara:strand:+ start:8999 stop:10138 length:1140 start_codon:yes stop_codon:yes gene_type:complete